MGACTRSTSSATRCGGGSSVLLADDGEPSARARSAIVQQEFGISQPAVSQHLRVLREHGFATVRPEGRRRLYALDPRGPREAREWLDPVRAVLVAEARRARHGSPAAGAPAASLPSALETSGLAADSTDTATTPPAHTDFATGTPPAATTPTTEKET